MKITVKQLKQLIKEEVQRLNEDTCPCGIERADCTYHQPKPSAELPLDEIDTKYPGAKVAWKKICDDRGVDVEGTMFDIDEEGLYVMPPREFGGKKNYAWNGKRWKIIK
jgi:hypothetical protein